jgi:hypothetical protein
MNTVVRGPEGNIRIMLGLEAQQLGGGVEGFNPWDINCGFIIVCHM